MKLGINTGFKSNGVGFPSLVDSTTFGTAPQENVYSKTKRARIENLCDG